MTERTGRPLAMSEGGPWGGKDEDQSGGKGGDGPRNPWTPPPRDDAGGRGPRGPSAIDELLRRARESFGGGMPNGPTARSLWPYAVGAVVVIWLALTSFHSIGAKQQGVVSFLGSYSRILTPGVSMTLPAPLETVQVIDVQEIRTLDLGSAGDESQRLMLTEDQNIIDLGYSVRWNISNPKLYAFQIADPDKTIEDVAESAMRAVIATVSLTDAMGSGRGAIETQVQQRMQEILDGYHAGIRIQGVAVKQADPPDAVNDAFKEVTAAQQTAETYINQSRTYAQQLEAQSLGETAAFDKVYEQYKLAPEVTRRRMYYETMETVLAGINKTIVEPGGVTPYLPLPAVRPPTRPSTSVEAVPAQGGGR
ncbi:protease modulator HflK [Sphingobium nicotianae]